MTIIRVIQMGISRFLFKINNKNTKTKKIYSNIVEYIYRELPPRIELGSAAY